MTNNNVETVISCKKNKSDKHYTLHIANVNINASVLIK